MEWLKTPFRNLIQTVWSIMDPVLDLFQNIWDNLVNVFQFIWGIIETVYYSFSTIISLFWDSFTWIINLSFFSDNSSNVAYLTSLIWISWGGLFLWLVFVIILYCIMKFLRSLIPFFKK